MLNTPGYQARVVGMRVHGFITAGLAALVLSGCVSMPRKKVGVVLPPPALRTTVATVPAPVVAPPPPVVRASAVVAPTVVTSAVISVSACAPNYLLDSGDR